MSLALAVPATAPSDSPVAKTCNLHVTDECGSHRVLGNPGETLLSALHRHGIAIGSVCGGNMICGTCHVWVAPDTHSLAPPAGEEENELLKLSSGYRPQSSRLACQFRLTQDIRNLDLEVAPEE
jgi:2Fe-2S ferredoxin